MNNKIEEIWKDIPEYEGMYQCSNLGNIRSLDRRIYNYLKKGRLLKTCKAKSGYLVVGLCRKTFYVHRIIACTFIGEIGEKMTINHIDGDKENNQQNNLEILNYSENHLHAFNVLKRKPTNKGRTNTNVSKPITQFDLNNNKIKDFLSAREAERITGINYKNISACCREKSKSAGGFIWKFTPDNLLKQNTLDLISQTINNK